MRYIFLLLSFIIFSCDSHPKKCTYFRTGIFEYSNSDYAGWLVTRNDSIQIESNEKENIKLTGTIEWLSDCQYMITYKDAVNFSEEDIIGRKIIVDITKTFDESYKCMAKSETGNVLVKMNKIK